MRACRMLPHLKYAIKLPEDVAVVEKINHLTTQRMNDNVKEVAAAAHSFNDGFKHNIRNAINDREVATEQAISQDEFDKIDKQREEEEWNMLTKEEQDEKKKLDEMLLRLKLDGGTRKSTSAVPGGSVPHSLTSPAMESTPMRHHSKSTGSVRTNSSNGSRGASISSTSSRSPGDSLSRGSFSRGHRLSAPSGSVSGTGAPPSLHGSTHPNSVSPPISANQLGSSGGPARRRDTSFVGTRSSQYRMAGAAATTNRPSSPTINLRPQTPSVHNIGQDLNDHPGAVPSTHVVGQRITPNRSSKTTHVPRRTSNN